jgi:hypothetical protein
VEGERDEVDYCAGVCWDVVHSQTARSATPKRIVDGTAQPDSEISRWGTATLSQYPALVTLHVSVGVGVAVGVGVTDAVGEGVIDGV